MRRPPDMNPWFLSGGRRIAAPTVVIGSLSYAHCLPYFLRKSSIDMGFENRKPCR